MKQLRVYTTFFFLLGILFSFAREDMGRGRVCSLSEVVYDMTMKSPAVEVERLNFRNKLMRFSIYKDGYKPAISLNLEPVSFNRSVRMLQRPSDGGYTYVDDYSNTSVMGVSLSQKIGLTGGELTLGSNFSYLREFSYRRHSFNVTPFFVGYSQQLWGGRQQYILTKKIEENKYQIALKEYCENISRIQSEVLNFYLVALLGRMKRDFALQTMENADTLLKIASLKLEHGYIIEYDKRQIELEYLNAMYIHDNAQRIYQQERARLAKFLGVEEFDVDIPSFNSSFITEDEALLYLFQNNPMYQHQRIRLLESEHSLLLEKINTRFNARISLNYGVNKYAQSFSEAYRNSDVRQSVIISLQIPVFQWGINKNRYRIARNNTKIHRLETEKAMHDLEVELSTLINTYIYSIGLWNTARKAYVLSAEQLQMGIQRFSLGKVSIYDLITSQREHGEVMMRLYNSIKEVYTSYFAIRRMTLYDFERKQNLEDIYLDELNEYDS